jgi:hypothetical protein
VFGPSAAFWSYPSLAEAVVAWELWRDYANDPAEVRRVNLLAELKAIEAGERRPRRYVLAQRCGERLIRAGEWLRGWSEPGAAPPHTA